MIKVKFSNPESIDVEMQDEVKFSSLETIDVEVQDLDYIPDYKEYEKQRRINEDERVKNEIERKKYYEDFKKKVDRGEFNGTKDYEKLENIPQINNVALLGNKTSSELNLYVDTILNSEIESLFI